MAVFGAFLIEWRLIVYLGERIVLKTLDYPPLILKCTFYRHRLAWWRVRVTIEGHAGGVKGHAGGSCRAPRGRSGAGGTCRGGVPGLKGHVGGSCRGAKKPPAGVPVARRGMVRLLSALQKKSYLAEWP